MKKFVVPTAIAAMTIAADQALKAWSVAHFSLYEMTPIIRGWLALTRVPNAGLWGQRFSGLPPDKIEPYIRYAPTLLLLAVIVVFWKLRRLGHSTVERAGLALVVAGAISNLGDHWRSYFVVDTLRIRIGATTFQSCNLADLAIAVGVVMVAFVLVREILRRAPAA